MYPIFCIHVHGFHFLIRLSGYIYPVSYSVVMVFRKHYHKSHPQRHIIYTYFYLPPPFWALMFFIHDIVQLGQCDVHVYVQCHVLFYDINYLYVKGTYLYIFRTTFCHSYIKLTANGFLMCWYLLFLRNYILILNHILAKI